ncbi:MAG: hypothetical protein CYPHOPRED_000117 [Cyphobasidiales sp. Tagirdzhanova-0007]|nr:MAG: hypothetical protein CYPHOPRED_000117 [Cyphobasidiales sp. Tagirdzhanova-0007]
MKPTTTTKAVILKPGTPSVLFTGRTRWIISFLFSILLVHGLFHHKFPVPGPRDTVQFPPNIFHHLAQYSPYFSVDKYVPPPAQCTVDQVSILQRHGARYPTKGAAAFFSSVIDKLHKAELVGRQREQFAWLNTYRYDLGVEDMVPLGFQQSEVAGQCAFERYQSLAKKGLFLRASSSTRVVDSAFSWAKGFQSASNQSVHINPPLVISDALGSNDTLANKGCPRFRPIRLHWVWACVFAAPVIQRLQHMITNVELETKDIIVLFELCAFESVALERMSRFCKLFRIEEVRHYEYYQDLEKYYNRGYGNPLGPTQGVGYVNELLSRLTGQAVRDTTQTNTTLDSDPETFPLDKGIYADFTHDNTIAAIVSAIGLFRESSGHLPSEQYASNRSWHFGHIAPFSGRIVFERLRCDGVPSIRILVNDAVKQLDICGADQQGVCSLEAFVHSQKYAREDGQRDWLECGWEPRF